MASTKLIGTAPDQVPTNGDLGDLAFQSKESVEFTNGTGGLSHLDLTAIAQSKAVTAVDVFVYDTSKDSDGGAWRKRCQHTSWYNEPLNTATRGSRREFPAVAVIVATTNTVTIYDGDQPDLPMWLTINQKGSYSFVRGAVSSVSAMNGALCIGNGTASSLSILYLVKDLGHQWFSAERRTWRTVDDTVTLDTFSGESVAIGIVNSTVNDVAMTVLPNAPIDAATGLPIPTIAVATDGGVSVIKDDGTVVDLLHTISSYRVCKGVSFTHDGQVMYGADSYTSGSIRRTYVTPIPSADTYTVDASSYAIPPSIGFGASTDVTTGYYFGNQIGKTVRNIVRASGEAVAVQDAVAGITLLSDTSVQSRSQVMTSFLTSQYNTGWMPGDIKGAWLSDTTQETVVGAELVTNGTFDSNITGWTVTQGTVTWSGSKLYLQNTGSGSNARQTISTVPGKTYTLTGVFSSASGSSNIGISLGSTVVYVVADTGSGTLIATFTATSSTTTVDLWGGSNAGGYFDDVSCRLADADRSVNNKGLQVFGNITKTPVAAGADLVAYSGFSASNYLQQPYNSSIPVGANNELMFATWVKTTQSVSSACILFAISNMAGGQARYMYLNNGRVTLDTYGGGFSPTKSIADGAWHLAVGIYRANGSAETYVDGVKTDVCASFLNGTAAIPAGLPLYIGSMQSTVGTTPFSGEMALARVSATIPSAEQIAKMYNDEKALFQDNAKATLYGTSDAVTALAYDEDTNLLHVGTSSGRSVFNGLRRVDNTTDAVGACISAAGGMVAED